MNKLKKYNGIIVDKSEFSRKYKEEHESLPARIFNHTLDMLKYIGHNELEIKDSPDKHSIRFQK